MVLEFVVLDFVNVSLQQVEELIGAATSARLSEVESMLQLPQDPNLADQSGWTALAHAVYENHLGIARVLVEAGSRLDVAVGEGRWMPLSLAARHHGGGVGMAKLLLEAGASIDSRDAHGCTALALAADSADTEVVRLLLLEGAGVDLTDNYGCTALIRASASCRGHAEVVQCLLDFGSNAHHMSHAGTALVFASRAGHDAIVRLLLKHKAQVDDYAVFCASDKGHVNCVRLLLEAPGWRNARSSFARRCYMSWSLARASRHGNADLVQVLLEARADMERPFSDFTALMEASLYSRVDVVRVLLKAGCDTDATDPDGTTALMLASMTGHAEIVHMLLQAGADKNVVSRDGTTAMMEASSWGHTQVMGLLKPRKRKSELLP
ncbi:KIDINS220 [Symbiodinium sp. CCMP2592]|nr:KIDINS220 [Symbiodinium sp. CCMP2592]